MKVKLKIANGASESSPLVKNVSPTWEELLHVLSNPKVRPDDRSYILAGQCPSGVRGQKRGDLVKTTSMLMIDLDHRLGGGLSWDELTFDLQINLPFAWAAYTTRSYTGDSVNFRIIVPYASELDASKHRSAVQYVMNLLPKSYEQWFDKCSERANQPIFLPCVKEEGAPFEFDSGGGEIMDFNSLDLEQDNDDVGGSDDLDDLLSAQPVDISDDEVMMYLDALDPNTMSYGSDEGVFGWADVGMALAHQYGSSDKGFDLWVSWSEKNTEKHNLNGMRSKYNSFDVLPKGRRPITFASVIAEVKARGGIMSVSISSDGEMTPMEKLLEKARSIETLVEYNEFKSKMLQFNSAVLPDDARAMVAHEIANGFGKSSGMTKTVITKSITPKKEAAIKSNDGDLPKWAEGWCYIEKSCQFYHLPTDHAIVKEAFNARYDREIECVLAERSASQLVLVDGKLPTYADTMYFPGAAEVFTDDTGKEMVNAYIPSGVAPSEKVSENGQEAIDLMLGHLKMLIPDEREFNIVLDWFTYVYRHPGNRVNWALLIQGAQGTGKSYFAVLMGYLLGRNAKTLEANAIAERFTSWAHGSVLTTIEEVRISGTSKFNILDRMKTYITNDTVQIEEKGRDHRVVPNFTNYLMLTNHKDALPIDDGDRRYCTIYTAIQSEQELFDVLGGRQGALEYFDKLFSMTKKHAACLAAFLRDRKLSDEFNPKGRAPETRAKAIMRSLSISGEYLEVEDAISAQGCGIINDSIVDVSWLQSLCKADDIPLPKTRALAAILTTMGYEPFKKRIFIAKTKRLHSVWIRPSYDEFENVEENVKKFHMGDDQGFDCPF